VNLPVDHRCPSCDYKKIALQVRDIDAQQEFQVSVKVRVSAHEPLAAAHENADLAGGRSTAALRAWCPQPSSLANHHGCIHFAGKCSSRHHMRQ
jgi:hypothetical protein